MSTAGIWLGWWTLFVFGWGMGLLLIVVGVTGWAISSGKWMVTVKAVLGVVLVLMGALIIVQGIRGQSLTPDWMISEEKSATDQTQAASLEPEPSPVEVLETVEKEPVEPQPELPKPEPKPTKIEWVYSEAEGLGLAKEAGKAIIIDFYADWCPPCRRMDRVTFADKGVIEELRRFVAIKIDLTQRTSEAETAARKYRITHIPTYIFIDTQGRKTVVFRLYSTEQVSGITPERKVKNPTPLQGYQKG